jgi:hypothetical protein
MNTATANDTGMSMVEGLDLKPHSDAPGAARKLTYASCSRAGTSLSVVVDDAALVAGELVRTSIRQTRARVTLRVVCDERQVTLRVHDQGVPPTARRDLDTGAARSWEIVRRLSASWGYSEGPSGREMWATLRVVPGYPPNSRLITRTSADMDPPNA